MSEHEHDEPLTAEQVAAANEPDPDTEPDDDDGGDGDGASEQEPESESLKSSDAQIEDIYKKLNTQTRANATRISTILGDEAVNFDTCPMCSYFNTPGFVYSGQLPADLTEHILHLLNQHAPSEYIADTHSETCASCNGLGMVLSGSRAPGQELLPCAECSAKGWRATDNVRSGGVGPGVNGALSHGAGGGEHDAAMLPAVDTDTPEIRALKAQGFVVIPPVPIG